MSEEIKELLFLLHNDKLTEAGKRKLEQEIERLNNIINKLDNWLEENRYHIEEYDGVLTYLRKLKGDDKE